MTPARDVVLLTTHDIGRHDGAEETLPGFPGVAVLNGAWRCVSLPVAERAGFAPLTPSGKVNLPWSPGAR